LKRLVDTFYRRAAGWLGRREIGPDEALVIRPCRSIHTCFMRCPIGVAFVDSNGQVLAVHGTVPPWRFLLGPKSSDWVVEFAAGESKLRAGQAIRLISGDDVL